MTSGIRDNEAPFHLGYVRGLDGLRGVAILAVLALHFQRNPQSSIFYSWGRAAAIGVDAFFVLSGFLITSLLIEEWDRSHRMSLKRFYIRRALRLLPALGAMLIATILYSWCFVSRAYAKETARDALIALFYSSNWAHIIDILRPGLFSHTWSLSIEEQFYIFWPITLLWLLRRESSRGSLLRWIILGIFLSVTVRVALVAGGADWARIYFGTDTRADSLLTGCAAAVLIQTGMFCNVGWAKRGLKVAAWVSAAALVLQCFYNPFTRDFDFQVVLLTISLFAVCIIMEVVLCKEGLLSRLLSFGPLVYIGKISYGLYVWHMPIIAATPSSWALAKQLALDVPATAAVAVVSFYLIERPFLRLKRGFEGAAAAIPVTAAPTVSG